MDVANSETFALDGGRTTVVHLIPGPFRVVLVNAATMGFLPFVIPEQPVKNYSTNRKKLLITLRMRSIWDAARITWTPLVSICHRIRVHGQHLGYIMLGEQIYGGALGAAALAICFHLLHYQIREPCVNLLKDLYFAYVLSLLGKLHSTRVQYQADVRVLHHNPVKLLCTIIRRLSCPGLKSPPPEYHHKAGSH
ncbi:unnamed protein product [Sphagnum balticum]